METTASAPLNQLLTGLEVRARHGSLQRVVRGISDDDRCVIEGYAFVARRGDAHDGHDHIVGALDRGAVAVVHERPVALDHRATYLQVPDARIALSVMAAALNGTPAQRLTTLGITGTNGKTSTAWFLHQMLVALGERSGLLTTAMVDPGTGVVPNPWRQSTPSAHLVQELLGQMVKAGCTFAIVEATSHGLSPRTQRLHDVSFDAAVFTNLTHEHLEFHRTFSNYRDDKANLFRQLKQRPGPRGSSAFGVVNATDPAAAYFRAATARPVYSFAREAAADCSVRVVEANLAGTDLEFVLDGERGATRTQVLGEFQALNLAAAVLTLARLGVASLDQLLRCLPQLAAVPGRLQAIDQGQPFHVIVDYAHSPDAFEQVLPFARRLTPGRLILVFGSAGERDVEKRPLQGRIGTRFADVILLSDEDPRGEPSAAILQQIAAGCDRPPGETLLLIPDRREAIRRAIGIARPGDTVLLLGKGHETSIIQADGPHPWDEAQVARSILADTGFVGGS